LLAYLFEESTNGESAVQSKGAGVVRLKLIAAVLGVVGLMVLTAGASSAKGPPEASFYVDGTVYRTVGTPTDFSNTGAPEHSFDTIYQFFGAQDLNVATAAPGDRDYNGGRWMVIGLEFDDYDAAVATYDTNGSGDFDSDEEVQAALDGGAATSLGVVKQFECPVIKLPRGHSA
jgi:hypothetical protein